MEPSEGVETHGRLSIRRRLQAIHLDDASFCENLYVFSPSELVSSAPFGDAGLVCTFKFF